MAAVWMFPEGGAVEGSGEKRREGEVSEREWVVARESAKGVVV
jgi:hypothetical protein